MSQHKKSRLMETATIYLRFAIWHIYENPCYKWLILQKKEKADNSS